MSGGGGRRRACGRGGGSAAAVQKFGPSLRFKLWRFSAVWSVSMSKRRSADCPGHLNAVALRFKPILADHWAAGDGPRRRGRPARASIGFCNYLTVFCGSRDGGVREAASRGGDAGVTPHPPPSGAPTCPATCHHLRGAPAAGTSHAGRGHGAAGARSGHGAQCNHFSFSVSTSCL